MIIKFILFSNLIFNVIITYMSKIYQDGTYLANNETWHEEDSPYKAKWIQKIIKKNSLNPKNICEIGCGSGETLNQLSQEYDKKINFFGYEVSPQAFEICKNKTKENLTFHFRNLLDEKDKKFDIAMIIDVIEHVEDYLEFLRKVKNKANYKIFHIPLDLSILNILRVTPIITKRNTVGHIHYFTKETALRTLEDIGYNIVDYFYTSGSVDLPNQGWKSNILRIPRKISFLLNENLCVRVLGGYSLMVLAK